MNLKTVLLFVVLILSAFCVKPQCTTLGQTPSTAFPVCGVDTFSQHIVPLCVNNGVPASFCGSYPDTNPFWYQFTCFKSGTLGFLITPDSINQDYDWELFDITGHSPNDIYTDTSLFVVANWCGTYGVTGTSSSAKDLIECASDPAAGVSTYSKMPTLVLGHVYLLLVSHYTQTQSGYKLTFGGGTASITDPGIPSLTNAYVSCDFATISIKLSKKVQCNTLSPDGTDFSISPALSSVVSARGSNCSNGFDMDSIIVKLNAPLPPGNYIISAKIGTDGNTLLDDCNNSVGVGDSAVFKIIPIAPTPLDSIAPVGCAPNTLQLVFSKPIQCNSIAANGTDFVVTGPSSVTVQSAQGICDENGLSRIILVNLSAPIVSGGVYQITLVVGTDGNTIIDECNQQTPAGSMLNFTTKDTVFAQFSYQVLYGCRSDSIQFTDLGGNGINHWEWLFDNSSSQLQNPLVIDTAFGQKHAQLVVSNGVCSDTSSIINIFLDNLLKADFSAPDHLCPTDKASFESTSIGTVVSWYWDFGDGTSSTDSVPLPHQYPPSTSDINYLVKLVVQNNLGCFDTTVKAILKVKSCYITVPSGFTPNGDGINDYLYPLNAYKATNLEFRVFNRYGQLIFETKDWTRKWDGTINGKPQDIGTYVWMLQYTDKDTGKKYALKGTTVLIR
jgi:gliding motility-associated-like protein